MSPNVEISSSDRPMHGGLVEAYKNYYEEEIQQEYDRVCNESPSDLSPAEVALSNLHLDYEHFVKLRVRQIILEHTPKQRLEVYLEWNGIMGYTDTIFTLSRGEVYAREW